MSQRWCTAVKTSWTTSSPVAWSPTMNAASLTSPGRCTRYASAKPDPADDGGRSAVSSGAYLSAPGLMPTTLHAPVIGCLRPLRSSGSHRAGPVQRLDHGLGDVFCARGAAEVAGEDAGRGDRLDGLLQPGRLLGQAEVLEHQRSAADGADGVGQSLPGDVGRGAVHGLEHAGETPFRVEVGAGRQAEAA